MWRTRYQKIKAAYQSSLLDRAKVGILCTSVYNLIAQLEVLCTAYNLIAQLWQWGIGEQNEKHNNGLSIFIFSYFQIHVHAFYLLAMLNYVPDIGWIWFLSFITLLSLSIMLWVYRVSYFFTWSQGKVWSIQATRCYHWLTAELPIDLLYCSSA